MNTLERCISYASEKHSGQWYIGLNGFCDEPYICHSLRVMLRVSQHKECADELMQIGVLHDVLEDCGVNINDVISNTGISALVAKSLIDITKIEDNYSDYIKRLTLAFWPARVVKICDLQENLSRKPIRFKMMQYETALYMLNESLNAEGISFHES